MTRKLLAKGFVSSDQQMMYKMGIKLREIPPCLTGTVELMTKFLLAKRFESSDQHMMYKMGIQKREIPPCLTFTMFLVFNFSKNLIEHPGKIISFKEKYIYKHFIYLINSFNMTVNE